MILRHHHFIRARELRSEPTEAESLLWKRLRRRQVASARFRRQHPIGNYIADFVCLEAKLIIEVDGSQHVEQANYDSARSAYLTAAGFEVLRVWNNDVMRRPHEVMDAIYATLEHRLRVRQPPPSALRAPSPASGGR